MSDDYVLAADMGGTNLRTSAVSRDGSVVHQRQVPTPRGAEASAVVTAIVDEAELCISELGRRPIAFGLAAAALVDSAGTRVLSSPNLPQLNGLSLADKISDRLGIAVTLENDATAASIGEHWLGASRDVDISICVTLGTGVGGGLIVGGRPFRGASGTAGEVGHICVEPDGVACGCGSHGCLEQYASATAMVRIAREIGVGRPGSKLTTLADFAAVDVYDAGLGGDRVALETFERVGRYLGIAFAGLVNVLNPHMIVIGGGGAGAWNLFIDHVREEMSGRAFEHPAKAAALARSELGNRAGFLGAAKVAFDLADSARETDQSLS
jgi:glucokinase